MTFRDDRRAGGAARRHDPDLVIYFTAETPATIRSGACAVTLLLSLWNNARETPA
jgi:hypothetical protein